MAPTHTPATPLALIAGGAGGVGQAIAAAVRQRGGQAILMGRTEAKLRDAAAALGGCPYVVADLTDRTAGEAMAQAILLRGRDHKIFFEAWGTSEPPEFTGR